METLPAMRPPLPVLTDEVLALVAKLHPDEALARIAPLWSAAKPGFGKRALLAARIALMRKAVTVAPLVAVVPEPVVPDEPEPVAEPVFVPAPPPKPLAKGALTMLNLEDAAKMLLAGGEEAEAAAPPAAVDAGNAARAGAEAELAEVIAVEAALVAAKTKGKKAKPAAARPAVVDVSAQFADLASDLPLTGEAIDAGLALIDKLEEATGGAPTAASAADLPLTKTKGKAKPVVADLSADFAALLSEPAIAEGPLPAAGGKPAVADLSAQFAALEGQAEGAAAPQRKGKAKAVMPDLSAQFAALGDAGGADPAPAKAKAPVIDLSAQFAALDGAPD